MQDLPPRDVHPYLHDLVSAVCAPATVLSGADGQVRREGAQGLIAADVRHLSELVVEVDGWAPTGLGHQRVSAQEVRFVAAVRRLGDRIADPTVRVERWRRVEPGGLSEEIALVNDGRTAVRAVVTVRLAVDLASVMAVKGGRTSDGVAPRLTAGGVEWAVGSCRTVVTTDPASASTSAPGEVDGDAAVLRWQVHVPGRDRWQVTLSVDAVADPDGDAVFAAPRTRPAWSGDVALHSREPALERLTRAGLDDLAALALADSAAPGDLFIGAGSPWYLTLYGRDSIWTARFALPLGTDLASGTLRTLARRQGTVHDPATGEQPGKVLHEVRRVAAGVGRPAGSLPPSYYGTIDATPLWISLLHDAWRWGLPRDRVAELLGPLDRALEWVMVHGDEDGDGFIEYHDELGQGLANQGWKDSGDAIQDAAGTLARSPVTLSEAQAYAHRAVLDGAALLAAFDRPGAEQALAHAADIEKRFRAAFWVEAGGDRFPAVALDRDKRPVDALTSNIGHLLGSGLLSDLETATVARWLADPRLDSGRGVRTLDATHPRFNPLGYHTGSVWPHDTAIAIGGLARSGHPTAAAALAAGLLRAADRFGDRPPELYGGWSADQGPLLAYPAACRPQAWAAAAVLVLVQAALGLDADVPAGELRVRPAPAFAAWFPLAVTGLRVAGHPLTIEVDRDGRAVVATTAPLTIVTS